MMDLRPLLTSFAVMLCLCACSKENAPSTESPRATPAPEPSPEPARAEPEKPEPLAAEPAKQEPTTQEATKQEPEAPESPKPTAAKPKPAAPPNPATKPAEPEPKPTEVAAPAEPKQPTPTAATEPCGEKGQPRCPLQAWMEDHLQSALDKEDLKAAATALRRAARFAPDPSWNDGPAGWVTISNAAAAAADSGDLAATQKSCKSCHKAWRSKYKASFRTRPLGS